MDRARKHWKRTPGVVRKPVVLVIGTAVIIGGIILLPLPGPGWLIIFIGLAILSTEFAVAEKIRRWILDKLMFYLDKIKETIKNNGRRK